VKPDPEVGKWSPHRPKFPQCRCQDQLCHDTNLVQVRVGGVG
jgi:hypothetical protein